MKLSRPLKRVYSAGGKIRFRPFNDEEMGAVVLKQERNKARQARRIKVTVEKVENAEQTAEIGYEENDNPEG